MCVGGNYIVYKNKIKNVRRLEKRLYSCSKVNYNKINKISDFNVICLNGGEKNNSNEVVSNNVNKKIKKVMSESMKKININHLVEKERIIMRKNDYKNKYIGGFTSYRNVVVLSNFIFTFNPKYDKIGIERECLLLSVRNFLRKLDEKMTYSVLFSAKSCNGENINHTISKNSMIVHKDFSEICLTEILINDINRYLNTYLSHRCNSEVNFNLIGQFKIWVSEKEYGKDKFMEIKRVIVEEGLKKLKFLTSVNRINSDDEVINKGLQNMKFYDFNLSYNHWFEKELFFSSLGGCIGGVGGVGEDVCVGEGEGESGVGGGGGIKINININNNKKLPLNKEDIIKLYNEFLNLLKRNKEVVYYLDDKYNDKYNDNDNDNYNYNDNVNDNVNDNNKLKIMFRTLVRGENNKNENENENENENKNENGMVNS